MRTTYCFPPPNNLYSSAMLEEGVSRIESLSRTLRALREYIPRPLISYEKLTVKAFLILREGRTGAMIGVSIQASDSF